MAEGRRHGFRLRAVVLVGCLLVLPGRYAVGQRTADGIVAFESPASEFRQVSQAEYLEEMEQLQVVVANCKAKATACEADKAKDDVTVADGSRRFDVRRAWLRNALNDAKAENDAERADLMTKAAARLNADAQEAVEAAEGVQNPGQDSASVARRKADAILSRREFRTVQQEGWLDQRWAAAMAWVGAVIDGFFSRIPHSSMAAPLLMWGVLFAAAVGLIVWAWRVTQQQRVELAVPDADRLLVWQREYEDWARRAEAKAASEDWREAVHCLYWAAIVMLEGRRFWRPNRARTPREYLPLLEAGSPRQRALGGLTRIFERIWYGLRPAARSDFERAQALLDELKAA